MVNFIIYMDIKKLKYFYQTIEGQPIIYIYLKIKTLYVIIVVFPLLSNDLEI